jgi:transposase
MKIRRTHAEKREMVERLYVTEGLSIRQVAERMGVTFQAVQSMLARRGIPRRPRGGNTGTHSRHSL